MGFAYQIKDQEAAHYVTFTVHQWVDVFTRPFYKDILLSSIKHCQDKKGLEVFAWVLMTNHMHMIVRSSTGKLSDTVRDFKKFTSTKLVEAIEGNTKESRRSWLLWLFKKNGAITFWEEGFHPEEVYTKEFFDVKANYIHLNPVRAGIVEKEEEYLYSSCGDIYGVRKGLLELVEF